MPLWNEGDDRSITADSVFDWGSTGGSKNKESVAVSTLTDADGLNPSTNKNVSRYDPKAMNRISDINDLVDESSDEDDESIIGHDASSPAAGSDIEMSIRKRNKLGRSPRKHAAAPWCRQTVVLVSVIGIIAAASMAIGWAVVNSGSSSSKTPYSIVDGDENGGIVHSSSPQQQQQLLETAERVVLACSENQLDEDMAECQSLCHSSMCCFEEGEYSCEDDQSKDCAVYAGCEALVEGIPFEGAEEDEE